MVPRVFGRHTVAIVVILHQARRSDPHSFFDIAIKGPTQRAQHDLLICKNISYRAILLIGMSAIGQLLAAQVQPAEVRQQIAENRIVRLLESVFFNELLP